jgi:hypothetical protein
MPAKTLRVSPPRSRVSCSSLSAPSTGAALAMRAMRRSTLAKVVEVDGLGDGVLGQVIALRRRAPPSSATAGGGQVLLRGLEHGLDLLRVDAGHQRLELGDLVVQQRVVQVGPGQRLDLQELLGGLGGAGQDRLEPADQQPEQVQPLGADALQLGVLAVLLGDHPGRLLVDVLVGLVGQGHDLAHRAAELALFVEPRRCSSPALTKVSYNSGSGERHSAVVEALGDKARTAARDVDDLADQVGSPVAWKSSRFRSMSSTPNSAWRRSSSADTLGSDAPDRCAP